MWPLDGILSADFGVMMATVAEWKVVVVVVTKVVTTVSILVSQEIEPSKNKPNILITILDTICSQDSIRHTNLARTGKRPIRAPHCQAETIKTDLRSELSV